MLVLYTKYVVLISYTSHLYFRLDSCDWRFINGSIQSAFTLAKENTVMRD